MILQVELQLEFSEKPVKAVSSVATREAKTNQTSNEGEGDGGCGSERGLSQPHHRIKRLAQKSLHMLMLR